MKLCRIAVRALDEHDAMGMLSNPDISGLRTKDVPIVDSPIPKLYPPYGSRLIVARDKRRIIASSVERDIVEINIFHPEVSRGMDYISIKSRECRSAVQAELLDPDIPVSHISDRIVVSAVNRKTPPNSMVRLRSSMLEHIDIFEQDVFDDVTFFRDCHARRHSSDEPRPPIRRNFGL